MCKRITSWSRRCKSIRKARVRICYTVGVCLSVHIASNTPLPVSIWNPDARAFYLEAVSEDALVRDRFSLPFVYSAGSHLGCGCGFQKYENDGERDKTQANYTALAGVIRDVLSSSSSVEIFTCWEGDHAHEPELLESVSVSELILPEFELKERQLLRVRI
jgi:hypothetical protein